MYKKILNTLFQWNKEQACQRIFSRYDQQGFCIVHYLYFANISGKQLFSYHKADDALPYFCEALLADYKSIDIQYIYKTYQNAIFDADLVLPDGIALQLFYFLSRNKRLKNLNWTDFCPYFLSYIKEHYPNKVMNIILYWTYPHLLEKTKKLLLSQWYSVVYAQDGYTNLDWYKLECALQWNNNAINILLIARTTPDYPIQEIWSFANKDRIRKHKLLVMNQWGTFDFWVGDQKRAPKCIRSIKLEWLRRLIATPRRQIKKTLHSLAILKYIFSYLILKKE